MFTSLNSKFIIPAVLIVSGIIGVSSWMSLTSLSQFLADMNRDRLTGLIRIVELGVIDLMLDKHGTDLQERIEGMHPGEEVTAIRIFNDKGVVDKSRDRSDLGKTLEDFGLDSLRVHGWSAIFEMQRNGSRSYAIAEPIINRPICHTCHGASKNANGLLFVEASFLRTENQISAIRFRTAAYTALTIAVLSLGMWWLLSRLITQPVAEMIAKMKEAQRGDLSSKVNVNRSDELGTLGKTYNAMLDRLTTTRKELESLYRQQIQRADRLASLGELASSIAHEIKNPLGGISGAIQILKEDYPAGDARRSVLEEILRQIQRLDKTTKDLLSFARPSLPRFSMTNINSLLQNVLLLVEPQARKQGGEITTDLDAAVPDIMVDEEQMRQALLNLCLNGVQAMPDKGRLTIRTEAKYYLNSDIILISIRDTGEGILQEHLSRIFDPFFTTKSQGTGLGLAIARNIVEGHGGGIFVESQVGQGTIFYVRLPVRKLGDTMSPEKT